MFVSINFSTGFSSKNSIQILFTLTVQNILLHKLCIKNQLYHKSYKKYIIKKIFFIYFLYIFYIFYIFLCIV